jgi:hypothetical protein
MEKKIRFTVDISDLKNSNLNTIFGHAGINYNKALTKIEEILKIENVKSGLYNFKCVYNTVTKDFNIIIKNINFSFIFKQFLFFIFLKNKNYFNDLEKNEKILIESTLILNKNLSKNNKLINDSKKIYIFYLYFMQFYRKFEDFKYSNEREFHSLNLIFLKYILKKSNLKNETLFH